MSARPLTRNQRAALVAFADRDAYDDAPVNPLDHVEALLHRGLIEFFGDEVCGGWFVTDAGRAALGATKGGA